MKVIFQSECEDEALKRTARILDLYAMRVGQRSWMTGITKEGLDAVHAQLRQAASKNTAVSCTLINRRTESELLWIVGNRSKFGPSGVVPVAHTEKNIEFEDTHWDILPVITALSALAALFHDIGKSNDRFQNKLHESFYQRTVGDPYRHEYISCLLLKAFILSVKAKNDAEWIEALFHKQIDEQAIMSNIKPDVPPCKGKEMNAFPVFLAICWLILVHHRMPTETQFTKGNNNPDPTLDLSSWNNVKRFLLCEFGYENGKKEGISEATYGNMKVENITFSQGLSFVTDKWVKEASKWAGRLQESIKRYPKIFDTPNLEILYLSRLCLVLGDHYFSSLDCHETNTFGTSALQANTIHDNYNQTLEQHLIGVEKQALILAHNLPFVSKKLERVHDLKVLEQNSYGRFAWQDKAARVSSTIVKENRDEYGWFMINMASTGCGKTLANVKTAYALSSDKSLRITICLGLRTLTLQTGEEYRKRMELSDSDLAIVIGSRAFTELANASHMENDESASGSDEETLVDDEIDGAGIIDNPKLNDLLMENKSRKFLSAPVLVCTLDQMIRACETTRGAKGMVPLLRLLSSDIVIDEIDEYIASSLIAVGRFVFLVGAMGRRLMISSATIPPEMARFLCYYYQWGWRNHATLHDKRLQYVISLIDEFDTKAGVFACNEGLSDFQQGFDTFYKKYIGNRVSRLQKIVPTQIGELVDCGVWGTKDANETYYQKICQEMEKLHKDNHEDAYGKKVSFGLVRFSNIRQCVGFARYAISNEQAFSGSIKLLVYHARQVMLIRHEIENYLDKILCRKNPQDVYSDPVIEDAIQTTKENDIMFVVVSSPIEELGRDHDFDWAVIEPASYRSIIQTAGRVQRHRHKQVKQPNVGILRYNFKAFIDGDQDKNYFLHPGFETEKKLRLPTHDLCRICNGNVLAQGINSIPRLLSYDEDAKGNEFVQLEHTMTAEWLDAAERTAYTVAGFASGWFTNAYPVVKEPFREQNEQCKPVAYVVDEDGTMKFCHIEGARTRAEKELGIHPVPEPEDPNHRLWLKWTYDELLEHLALQMHMENPYDLCWKYGELVVPVYGKMMEWEYNLSFGLCEKTEEDI